MGATDSVTHSGVLTVEGLQEAINKLKAQPVITEPTPHLMTDNIVDYYLNEGIIPENVIVSPRSAKKIKAAKEQSND